MGIVANNGVFNLFKPTDDPDTTYMVYELAFQHEGKDYYLAGHKNVRDDHGFDLWSDTTTLYTCLYQGKNKQGPIVGAGILTLGVKQLTDLLSTIEVPGAASLAEKTRAIEKFGAFFAGKLWDTYVIPKFGKQIIDKSYDETLHYDVIVIGSGFGGGDYRLQASRKRIESLYSRTRSALGSQGLSARSKRCLVVVQREARRIKWLD